MIRSRRIQLDLTLTELAARSGLSAPFLSQVERGSAGLSVTSLKQIAQALEVSTSYFLEVPEENDPVHSVHDLHYFGINGSRIRYARLGSVANDRELEPLYVIVPPKYASEPFKHPGEEFFYVLKGQITIKIGKKTHRLGPGSAVHYKSGIRHLWRNDGDEEAHVITVNTPRLI